MKNKHGEGVLFLALLASLAGCTDPANRALGPAERNDQGHESTLLSGGDERAALSKIARLVALAIDNEPARQRLKRDMRAAPFREHKLELTPYLKSSAGKQLLTRMVALSGGTETDLFNTLSRIRNLEFYMPVRAHREQWTGSANVLVASQLDESEPIVAFDERGKEVTVDAKAAPSQPTLSIVPIETNFKDPIPALERRNVRDQNGAAIGTLERVPRPTTANLAVCDDACSGGGTGTPSTIPSGLYLEFSRILDMKEPWIRGDPEIEVHIQGPTDLGNPRYGSDLSCSGEHAYDYKKVFDQNDGFWTGRVMLFSAAEATTYASKFTSGFDIMYWEDDNVPCTLKTDSNALKSTLESTGKAGISLATQLLKGTAWYITAGLFVASLFSSSDWLLTNDDFVGIAVVQGVLGYSYPDNTHVIMDGSTLNGRATIVWH
jgi:hypothetical protein